MENLSAICRAAAWALIFSAPGRQGRGREARAAHWRKAVDSFPEARAALAALSPEARAKLKAESPESFKVFDAKRASPLRYMAALAALELKGIET